MKRIAALDGLRGLAILLVLMFHYSFGGHTANKALQAYSFVASQGWIGVTLFFVLSGFLITGILWDSRGQDSYIKSFYIRRACRIFPLYYLALGLVVAAACLIGQFHVAAGRIIYPALFLQDFPGAPAFAINSTASPLGLFHFWSLAVEEHFYLVCPFVL